MASVSNETSASIVMQARVPADFAHRLLDEDAQVLGLEGTSEIVREGLRLLHKQARERAMALDYEKFYQGQRAPLPTGVVPDEDD